ncbi:MAG TPA: AMP-binding protein [Ktedonobacteraceae bacterium]|nr:AMP-binding protein [Ktedonobacteraceae bacterium]HVB75895.1 AMP-binding protein [Ktedonobacteraceae bacterium]
MKTINTLFASAAKRFHARIALLEPTDDAGIVTYTYAELQAKVHRFTGYLQEKRIEKGERILIWSASRVDWMVAFLGTLLAGGVIVPLDVNSKQDFLERIAQTTEATCLITTQKQYATLKNPSLTLIDLDNLPQGAFDAAALPEVEGNDLAELVFTSGTTGQPKGVMLSHWNIASDAMASLQGVDIHADDRTLSILPLSHTFELTIEMAEFEAGASILYARTLVPDTLLKLLGSQGVTCMVLVPQALQLFMNGIERQVRMQKKEKQWEMLHRVARRLPFNARRRLFGAVHKRFGGHFRFFVSGGAYLSPKLAERWENMGFRVMQGYGTSECSPVVSVTRPNDHTYESIGHPLPGIEVRIAEDGELLVHGPNVAQGYWKNPEATAAVFQNGWYYTGDLGSKDEKGRIYLKGRKKNLIVLANGLNVYPEDIENLLLMNPLVKDAVVVGLMEKGEGPTVYAILLMEDPSQARAVIQQTNKQLASHQQVRGYTVWPEKDFPRTHTLKVRRPEVMEKLQAIRSEVKVDR